MTEDTDLARRRLRAWLRLLRIIRPTENHLREFLRKHHNSTLPRFDVMAALHRADGPMKMSDLSRQLLVSNGNSTATVKPLVDDGLVERVENPDDRRIVLVNLTEKGRAAFSVQAKAHAREIDRLFGNLNAADLDMLRDLTRKFEGAGDDFDG